MVVVTAFVFGVVVDVGLRWAISMFFYTHCIIWLPDHFCVLDYIGCDEDSFAASYSGMAGDVFNNRSGHGLG